MVDVVKADDLLRILIKLSEKAAYISRECRAKKELFELLVEEKTEIIKNKRCFKDFKTLADVLIQEMVRHELSEMFPILGPKIYGEESNQFTNMLQQQVTVEVTKNQEQTFQRLQEVLNGDTTVARLLTDAVYSEVDLEPSVQCCSEELPLSQLGIWIDPIDGTNEYISGKDVVDRNGISVSGLRCVCVLIGVFNLTTGAPLIGVVNQPFSKFLSETSDWQGLWAWGVVHDSKAGQYYVPEVERRQGGRLRVVLSSSEEELAQKLSQRYDVIQAAGAGHKLNLVLLRQADLYLLTKGSTFCWDTCAPHAILRARGGGIVRYADALASSTYALRDSLPALQLTYHHENARHLKGILAYLDPSHLEDILTFLQVTST